MTNIEVDGWARDFRRLLAQKGSNRTPAQAQDDENTAAQLGIAIAAAVLKDIGRIADALERIAIAEQLGVGLISPNQARSGG